MELFGFQIFQGGFFGVDVFFVLSGYLVTAIIRDHMAKGIFSFRDFYWRRAKRIIPALIAMLLVTSVLAFAILLPSDLITYAKSLQSTLYFGSNHFFYGEDSYTAAKSIYRPLLHTWSLSVEWQFYIIFPFIVWGVNRFFPKYMFGALLTLALISLQAADYIVKINPDMAFYLFPSRAWELILGGLVTFYNRTNVENSLSGNIVYQSLPVLGLFLIIHSMIFFGHEVPHPSFITLLPVLGTCLFIMFTHKGEITNDFMSLKPLVGIGLISYSLYLWHQPVFVFFRLIKHDHFQFEEFLLLLAISFILALASYFMIERAFKKKVISNVSKLYLLSAISLCLLFSYFVISNKGYPSRVKSVVGFENHNLDKRNLLKLRDTLLKEMKKKNPLFNNVENKVLIIGNSHATDLFNALTLNKPEGFDFLRANLPQVSCFDETKPKLNKIRNKFFSSQQYLASDVILISTRYKNIASCFDRTLKVRTQKNDLSGLPFLVKRAHQDGKKVFIFGNNAEFHKQGKYLPADYIYQKYKHRVNNINPISSVNKFSYSKLNEEIELNIKLKSLANRLGIVFVDKISLVCELEYCYGYDQDGFKTYADTNHWTLEGAKLFGKRLIDTGFLDRIREGT